MMVRAATPTRPATPSDGYPNLPGRLYHSIRPPPPSSETGIVGEIPDLISGDLAIQALLGGNSGDCMALLPNGALCDAPVPAPRPGRGSVGGDWALVLTLGRYGLADRGFRKTGIRLVATPYSSAMAQHGGSAPLYRALGDYGLRALRCYIRAPARGEICTRSTTGRDGPMSLEVAWS